MTAVGILATTAPAAVAAPKAACPAVINKPCTWESTGDGGIVGAARIYAPDDQQLTILRVEVKTEPAWGRPWETVASATQVQAGSFSLTTPVVDAQPPTIVCATGGPLDRPDLQWTTCTTPY